MAVISRLFQPLVQATRAFFRHDIALKRGETGVEIVLEARPSSGRRLSPQEQREQEARRKQKLALELLL